jgi:asparagine synthase (glutamine-hydrolysing)
MMSVLRHRGPDGEGIYRDDHAIFGHVRLSIIDVEGSDQPLCNEDESIWITYNGEIYNFLSLREELLKKGHLFRTRGDAEVIVHLYEDYGEQMVSRLNGMFALAIWDTRKQRLFLARDRMGIKPMYFVQFENAILFASEPKALLQDPAVHVEINAESLWHYLTYRSVPAPATLYKGISKLLPAHYLVFSSYKLQVKEYWDIHLRADTVRSDVADAHCHSLLEETLTKAVTTQMSSDVPVGALLSGGVDSSLIVAIMSKVAATRVNTYTVGFSDCPLSELPYARAVAEQYHTDHHELLLTEETFMEYLEEQTWLEDAPLSEPADIPLHLLARMASRDVKVLMSGEGSDELFGGYPKNVYDRFHPVAGLLPLWIVTPLMDRLSSRYRRLEILLRSLTLQDCSSRWDQWFASFTSAEKDRLIPGACQHTQPSRDYVRKMHLDDSLASMLYCDCKTWLADNLLDRGDRMTMAASVEMRVPYLDNQMVDLAFALPSRVKVRGFQGKWIIKQIAARYLPPELVFRPKVGFRLPLAQWFRGKLKDLCYDRICSNEGFVRELLSNRESRKVLDDHCADRKDNSQKIWTLLALSLWYEAFLQRKVQVTK